jgi:hypothetical protein
MSRYVNVYIYTHIALPFSPYHFGGFDWDWDSNWHEEKLIFLISSSLGPQPSQEHRY